VAGLSRVLVANRGEIALRVVRGCRALGIEAVVAHEAADARSPAVEAAGGAVEVASYLDPGTLAAAAREAGCDALHPGYGFLSERAALAEACAEAGVVFVGPSPDALRRLGDKIAARELAVQAGFERVPGGTDPDAIPLPILVKAAAGGGGRGMRVVRDREALPDAMASAAREAEAAFGDPTLYLEAYLEGARHVEVQMLGDGARAVHLGLRDCSLQRRHQKVVEEAPAPGIDEAEQERLGGLASRLLESVGYAGAATVELLRAADGRIYFLEVNARLQVEHPVTELVTGEDLVAWQLRIAGGERLPAELPWHPRGHAVEARLVAEDPASGFLPTAGRLLVFRPGEGVRVDAGYAEGDEVTTRYDGLLAKLIAHAPTREAAFDRLRTALQQTVVLGLQTNLPLLLELTGNAEVRAGRLHTQLVEGLALEPGPSRALDAAAARAGRFRIGLAAAALLPFATGLDGALHVVEDGWERVRPADVAPTVEITAHGHRAGTAGAVTSPMPGRVVAVRVAEGDEVAAGDVLVVLEAMKMEHPVTAPYDGTVSEVACRDGETVAAGATLVTLDA
jgi:acetyl/propionyl-CoA carboxylase alpha subunit